MAWTIKTIPMKPISRRSCVQRQSAKKLHFYQKSNALYVITYYFTQNYLSRGDRTIDQMVQAARSGKGF